MKVCGAEDVKADFEQLNKKYILLQKEYRNSFHDLNKDIDSKVCRREYAKGGATLHRGYYSPSAADLTVGNCSRGRLLKKPPENNNYDYEYLFDNHDKLICVRNYTDEFDGVFSVYSIELFIYLRGFSHLCPAYVVIIRQTLKWQKPNNLQKTQQNTCKCRLIVI